MLNVLMHIETGTALQGKETLALLIKATNPCTSKSEFDSVLDELLRAAGSSLQYVSNSAVTSSVKAWSDGLQQALDTITDHYN